MFRCVCPQGTTDQPRLRYAVITAKTLQRAFFQVDQLTLLTPSGAPCNDSVAYYLKRTSLYMVRPRVYCGSGELTGADATSTSARSVKKVKEELQEAVGSKKTVILGRRSSHDGLRWRVLRVSQFPTTTSTILGVNRERL